MIAHIGRCGQVTGRVLAPASKSYTHRALCIAALAHGRSLIRNPLDSDDTRITASALQQFGAGITWKDGCIYVDGTGGKLITPDQPVDIKDSGTSMRFLTSLSLLCDGPVVLTGSRRMQQRPISPLVTALNTIGGRIRYQRESGYPPLIIDGTFHGGTVSIESAISSQFISSLLITAPYGSRDLVLRLISDPVSAPYIEVTQSVMESFGVTSSDRIAPGTSCLELRVQNSSHYQSANYTVEGDFSAASYWFALAAICGGEIIVEGLNSSSAQGDRIVLTLLQQMGCDCETHENTCIVRRKGRLRGLSVDMASAPDVVQTIASVAAFADGETTITGISHLRHKESDRIAAIMEGITACGGFVQYTDEKLIILPAPLHGSCIDPKADHRTAMSFAILGCGTGDMVISDAGCVSKSYPQFWNILGAICHQTELS